MATGGAWAARCRLSSTRVAGRRDLGDWGVRRGLGGWGVRRGLGGLVVRERYCCQLDWWGGIATYRRGPCPTGALRTRRGNLPRAESCAPGPSCPGRPACPSASPASPPRDHAPPSAPADGGRRARERHERASHMSARAARAAWACRSAPQRASGKRVLQRDCDSSVIAARACARRLCERLEHASATSAAQCVTGAHLVTRAPQEVHIRKRSVALLCTCCWCWRRPLGRRIRRCRCRGCRCRCQSRCRCMRWFGRIGDVH